MHIAEGVLSAPVLIAGAAVAAGGVWWGLKKLRSDEFMLSGLLGAVFFVASLIHIPIGVSSAHLVLNGLLGAILGFAAFPVIFVGLLLQAVLFQFGGFTVLGVNTATMGLGAVFAGWCFHFISGAKADKNLKVGAFIAGSSGVLVSSLLTALALAFSEEGFLYAAWALFISNLPIMIIEGVITIFVVMYLKRSDPTVLYENKD